MIQSRCSASTVAGGVLIVQLSYQVFWALSFLGARAVSMAALPRLAVAAGSGDSHRFAVAWRQGLYFAVIASLPSLCLLAAFSSATADLLANGELRAGDLIGELAACLAVAAFAQMAGGIHDYGRQALFSRLDDQGPRVASFVGLFVGVVVGLGTLLLPDATSRLAGLVGSVLIGELASAITVLIRLRRTIRPEPITTRAHVLAVVLATAAMVPVIAVGHWTLRLVDGGRLTEMGVLLAIGALTLAAFLLVVRYVGHRVTAEQP